MTTHAVESESRPRESDPAPATVAGLVAKARAAMAGFAGAEQERVDKFTFAAKRAALEAAGATVVATPTEIGPALKARMG